MCKVRGPGTFYGIFENARPTTINRGTNSSSQAELYGVQWLGTGSRPALCEAAVGVKHFFLSMLSGVGHTDTAQRVLFISLFALPGLDSFKYQNTEVTLTRPSWGLLTRLGQSIEMADTKSALNPLHKTTLPLSGCGSAKPDPKRL